MTPNRGTGLAAIIAGLSSSQRALTDWLANADIDPHEPSRLPGWSIGHVLTHIARNADSHSEMLDGTPQYGGDPERRQRDIEAGAQRSLTELSADVAATSARLIERFEAADPAAEVQFVNGAVTTADRLPLLRWREVEIHRVDLGVGFELDDMPSEYVRRDLRNLEMTWKARQPMGLGDLPAPVLAAAPSSRLGWLLGRIDIAGAPAAE